MGTCGQPRIGWQIDTFGHSKQQALIFKQLGFDGAFFARLDYRDKLQRIKSNLMEFSWKSSSNIGTNIFLIIKIYNKFTLFFVLLFKHIYY